jgi:hypothetical protein
MEPSTRLSTYLGLERLAEAADGQPTPDLRTRLDAAWDALTAVEVAWLRARRPGLPGNQFEDAARSRKTAAILAEIPTGETTAQNQRIAKWLTKLSATDRATLAAAAHVNAPSDETWRQVVAAVLARKPIRKVQEKERI